MQRKKQGRAYIVLGVLDFVILSFPFFPFYQLLDRHSAIIFVQQGSQWHPAGRPLSMRSFPWSLPHDQHFPCLPSSRRPRSMRSRRVSVISSSFFLFYANKARTRTFMFVATCTNPLFFFLGCILCLGIARDLGLLRSAQALNDLCQLPERVMASVNS